MYLEKGLFDIPNGRLFATNDDDVKYFSLLKRLCLFEKT